MFLKRPLLLGFALLTLLGAAEGAKPRPPKVKPAMKSDEKFTFVAYGDTRSKPNDHRAVIAEIVRLHPEFVLQSGDLVDDGRNAAQWTEFDQIESPLRTAHIAYYPARGNHDVGPYYAKRVTEPYDSGNPYFYAFTRHDNRFIIVDNFQEYGPGSLEYHWLEGELAKSKKFVNTFVVFHESPFSIGPHGPNPESLRYLHPLFVKYRPRAVFCGHDHLYYRTLRDGVTYLVTGGGGAPLYPPTNKDLALPGDVYASKHHAILCQVDGTRVTMTAITPEGEILDKITVGPK